MKRARPRTVIAVDAFMLAYTALPKAGCSSVKEALARVDPLVSLPHEASRDVQTWHRIYPTKRHRPSDWQAYRDHWRFCVVRDPARRLMSCYTDIVAGRGALRCSPRVRASGLPLMPDPDTFFQLLPRYRRRSSMVRHHALGAHVFLGPDLCADYDRVFRTSEMDALGQALSRRVGRCVRMPHVNRTEKVLTLGDLQCATIDAIRPFLDEEYAYLSGFYTNPLGPRLRKACAIPTRRVS